jgi:hypothetical protein
MGPPLLGTPASSCAMLCASKAYIRMEHSLRKAEQNMPLACCALSMLGLCMPHCSCMIQPSQQPVQRAGLASAASDALQVPSLCQTVPLSSKNSFQ